MTLHNTVFCLKGRKINLCVGQRLKKAAPDSIYILFSMYFFIFIYPYSKWFETTPWNYDLSVLQSPCLFRYPTLSVCDNLLIIQVDFEFVKNHSAFQKVNSCMIKRSSDVIVFNACQCKISRKRSPSFSTILIIGLYPCLLKREEK